MLSQLRDLVQLGSCLWPRRIFHQLLSWLPFHASPALRCDRDPLMIQQQARSKKGKSNASQIPFLEQQFTLSWIYWKRRGVKVVVIKSEMKENIFDKIFVTKIFFSLLNAGFLSSVPEGEFICCLFLGSYDKNCVIYTWRKIHMTTDKLQFFFTKKCLRCCCQVLFSEAWCNFSDGR